MRLNKKIRHILAFVTLLVASGALPAFAVAQAKNEH
jgi:hypothetical protein